MRTLSLVAATLLVGCAAPYRFITRAAPSPFTRPGCRVAIEHVHVDHLLVGGMPVGAYVAQKKAESADSFDGDLRAADIDFSQRIADDHGDLLAPGGTPDNTFVLRPIFTNWEPGYYAYFTARPSVADLTVQVIAPNGQLLDSIAIERRVAASLYNPSTGGRMRSALRDAGAAVDRYIDDNWLCARH